MKKDFFLLCNIVFALVFSNCQKPSPTSPSTPDPTWVRFKPMNTARQNICPVRQNEKIFVLGGLIPLSAGTAETQTAEVFDVKTQTWSDITRMPVPRTFYTAHSLNGKVYMVGGYHSGWFARNRNVYAYSTETQSWEIIPPMAEHKGQHAGAVYDNKIYIFGGLEEWGKTVSNTTQVYDPATKNWSVASPMPTARRLMSAAVVNSHVYVAGGQVGEEVLSVMEVYSFQDDTWRPGPDLPEALASFAMTSAQGKIYVFGGYNFQHKVSGKSWQFEPDSGTWTELEPMIDARHSTNAVAVGDTLYVIGGDTKDPNVTSYVPEQPSKLSRGYVVKQ